MARRFRFLRQWRFWLNYAVILLVTCWVPLLKHTATMTMPDGTMVKQETFTVRAYQSWHALFTKGPGGGQGMAVAMHVGLCFLITAAVWFIMFRPVIEDLPEPAPEARGEAPPPSGGDAPHD